MRAVTKAAIAATALAAVSAFAAGIAERQARKREATPSGSTTALAALVAPCPPESLPEGPMCVPVPRATSTADADTTDPAIPRTPDRPAALDEYALPITSGSLPKGAEGRGKVRGA